MKKQTVTLVRDGEIKLTLQVVIKADGTLWSVQGMPVLGIDDPAEKRRMVELVKAKRFGDIPAEHFVRLGQNGNGLWAGSLDEWRKTPEYQESLRKEAELEAQQLRAQLQDLTTKQQANLAIAQEQAQSRAESGEQATQADTNLAAAQDAIAGGVDVSIFGDFSEEALAKGIATLQAQMAQQMREQILSDVRKELEPLQRKEQQSVQDAHMQAIYSKHPDADEVVQSKEFADWAKSLPSIMQAAVDTALKDGTTQQIIEVFDAFKAGAGRATTTQAFKPATHATTARKTAPISLSEIAREPHRDSVQATLAVAGDNPAALLGAMENMTNEQIERLMNTV